MTDLRYLCTYIQSFFLIQTGKIIRWPEGRNKYIRRTSAVEMCKTHIEMCCLPLNLHEEKSIYRKPRISAKKPSMSSAKKGLKLQTSCFQVLKNKITSYLRFWVLLSFSCEQFCLGCKLIAGVWLPDSYYLASAHVFYKHENHHVDDLYWTPLVKSEISLLQHFFP